MSCLLVPHESENDRTGKHKVLVTLQIFLPFMTRTPARSSQIDELTAALHHLDLVRARVVTVIAALAGTPPPDSSTATPRSVSSPRRQPSVSPERGPPLLPTSDFRLGDRARIRFPSPGQQSTGTSRGGFLYIRTPNGDVIRRLPHNLTPL